MKNLMRVLAVLVALSSAAGLVQAADVDFSLNLNIGEPPVFIAPPALGFYVAVGVPYDMFFIDMNYYMYRGGGWYISSGYNGPWAVVQYRRLPRGLRRHKYEHIIKVRDDEYRSYERDRNNYKGKQYRPEKHEIQQEKQGNQENKENNRGGNSNKGHGKNK
ncbi:MAG: hypothetical protein PHU23_08810 [Dehalococcoidales bacterium]|nr:hypothetical protein [Dehalococcoidales bacterium]